MTDKVKTKTGAASTSSQNWKAINWKKVEADVHRLQMRIAKAHREKKHGKVKSLQWLLTHSYHAKLLSVRRVTQNRGAKTPGVDQICWNTPRQKMQAVLSMKRQGYKPLPLRRVRIPKKSTGKYRPLSIPVMQCRAMQALYLLALEPVAEMLADKNAYGFRPKRSAADAIGQCFTVLAQKTAACYVLEGDIQACFDSISHAWLLKNAPMDKRMLEQWLQAGYLEKGTLYPTKAGTPQGGTISPTLLTVTLSGLEKAVRTAVQQKDKVHICIYADDFIITGATKEVLEEKVRPVVEKFLSERGLNLSQEKTHITHIEKGFNFLGFNLRKFNGKLIIQPSKESVTTFLRTIRREIKSKKTWKTEDLIRVLNPKIRGWTNYYRHVCSKRTFSKVDHLIFNAIWKWAKRRHPEKERRWIRKKYFRTQNLRHWIFHAEVKTGSSKRTDLDLYSAAVVQIRRHIKIRAEATPYDATYSDYFEKRKSYKTRSSGGVSLAKEWCTG